MTKKMTKEKIIAYLQKNGFIVRYEIYNKDDDLQKTFMTRKVKGQNLKQRLVVYSNVKDEKVRDGKVITYGKWKFDEKFDRQINYEI